MGNGVKYTDATTLVLVSPSPAPTAIAMGDLSHEGRSV